MIISHKYKFVFLHNPKVGGTSVRRAIKRFSDSDINFYHNDPDPKSKLHHIDRAHIGIDEFSLYYPDLFARCSHYNFFSLWRHPTPRFYSSIHEYSKNFSEVDIRFSTPKKRKDFLFETIDMLRPFGCAEKILDIYSFTHFRPQWIYLMSEHHSTKVEAISLQDIEKLFLSIELLTGSQGIRAVSSANVSERVAMPTALSLLASSKKKKALLRRVPGVPLLFNLARKILIEGRERPSQPSHQMFGLSDQNVSEIEKFLHSFYESDFKKLPLE